MVKSTVGINVGEIIRKRRQERGLSLRELAAESGVSASHLARVERGERFPSVAILQKISEPLGFEGGGLLLLAGGYTDNGLDPVSLKGLAQVLLELYYFLEKLAPRLKECS